MTQESKDRSLEMIKMRLDGCTYREIGDKYGISKQCVQQSIANFTGKERNGRKARLKECVYPNIRKWIIEENITMSEFAKICGLSEKCIGVVKMRLKGEREFRISEIKGILKESRKTFEYMFYTENEET